MKKAILTNWKTTMGGILLAVGILVMEGSDGAMAQQMGGWSAIAGAIFGSVSARDSNISSENSGAKK